MAITFGTLACVTLDNLTTASIIMMVKAEIYDGNDFTTLALDCIWCRFNY
jgi:hypothetical protein